MAQLSAEALCTIYILMRKNNSSPQVLLNNDSLQAYAHSTLRLVKDKSNLEETKNSTMIHNIFIDLSAVRVQMWREQKGGKSTNRSFRLHGHHLAALGCSGCKCMPSVVEPHVERTSTIHVLLEFCCKETLACPKECKIKVAHK